MGHFSNCFVVSGVVYTGPTLIQMQLLSIIFFYLSEVLSLFRR